MVLLDPANAPRERPKVPSWQHSTCRDTAIMSLLDSLAQLPAGMFEYLLEAYTLMLLRIAAHMARPSRSDPLLDPCFCSDCAPRDIRTRSPRQGFRLTYTRVAN
jgi:hypothetical protein